VTFVREHPHARLVLTDLILSEVATRVRARAGADRAVALARSLLDSRRYEVLFVDAEVVRGALDRMARFADKRLSLTDCASFDLMERLGLESAFAFDDDFRNCGYGMVP
jgi:predicted nucleic acid-binding protein